MNPDTDSRASQGMAAGITGLAVNVVLFAAKLAVSVFTGAVSVAADAINNLSDAAGAVVTLVGFHLAGQRADAQHPFGHGRAEYLAGLAVSVLILLAGLELVKTSLERIIHPVATALSLPAAIVLALSVLAKLGLSRYNKVLADRAKSAALMSVSRDAMADALATGTVLAGLALTPVLGPAADGWLGLAVAVLILRSGWSAAKDTLDPLMGEPPDPETVAAVEQLILSHPPVSGIHDLVFHDYGPGRRMMSAHIEVPADRTLVEVHHAADGIERALKARFGLDAVLHVDPVEEEDPAADRLWLITQEAIHHLDYQGTFHDFHLEGPNHTELRFDAVISYAIPLSDDEIREQLTAAITAAAPGIRPEIGIDRCSVL